MRINLEIPIEIGMKVEEGTGALTGKEKEIEIVIEVVIDAIEIKEVKEVMIAGMIEDMKKEVEIQIVEIVGEILIEIQEILEETLIEIEEGIVIEDDGQLFYSFDYLH